MKRAVAHVPALERGLKILAWMTLQEEPVTLTQVARGVELRISEAQRPVACLEETGYLRRSTSGAYELSGKLFSLASHHPPLFRLRRTAEPMLAEFARQTGHSIHLSVPDGDAALMILDVPGEGLVRLSLRPGARFEPQDTLSGALLVAAGAIASPPGYKTSLAMMRAVATGAAIRQRSHQAEGVLDIGIALNDRNGHILGALTCSAIRSKTQEIREDRLSESIQQTGLKISAAC